MLRTFVRSAAFPFIFLVPATAAPSPGDFTNPPDSARPWVWGHWLHGNVDQACITRELEAMKRAGLGGVTMFDVAQPGIPAGPLRYMDPAWQDMFSYEIKEASRLGLEVMSHNGPGYSGNGGPWITPEEASQKIVDSATRIPGGASFSGKLPRPHAEGGFYRDIAVFALRETEAQAKAQPLIEDFDMKRVVWLNYIRWRGTRSAPLDAKLPPEACIPREHIVNLTGLMKADGSITWNAPAGQWTLLRIGHTWTGQKTLPATPESQGPVCDILDKRGIQRHFDRLMKRLADLAGPHAGKTFHSYFLDSWEGGGANWTEHMAAEFQKRRGYDIIPFLPVITGRVIDDLQTSERFLFDLRLTVSELINENFWAELQRLCRARGMKVAAQTYITTGNDFDAANYSDEPMGEFWVIPNTDHDYRRSVKFASSAANLNGRIIVGSESFTSTAGERWLSHPGKLKEMGDQVFALGANRFQFHRFAMQRFPNLKPGMMMGGWGQQYDSSQTWWEWSRPWHDYLARCQYMLRQGPVVTDVLAITPEEPLYRFEETPIPGFNYDACGPDNLKRVVMRDGKATIPGGPSYQLLTVAHHGTMSVARLKKLRELVAAGASLLGEPPLATPGLEGFPAADAELQALAADLWGREKQDERPFGKGRVFRGITPAEALQRLKVPAAFSGPPDVSWIQRRAGETDVFFVATSSDQPTVAQCTFRVSGKTAELWQPETGEISPLDLVPAADGRTSARIPFSPDGSAFVVFRPGQPKATASVSMDQERSAPNPGVDLTGPWKLQFPAGSGAPESVELPSLSCWTNHSDHNIRHFSGIAAYSKTFDLPEIKDPIYLDLGRVAVMARVSLNGKDLGILWKAPFRVEITRAAREGANDLRVEVVNLWPNRLIGDAALPADGERDANGRLLSWPKWLLEGKPNPSGRKSFVTFPLWKANEALQPSGLLGPVTISHTGLPSVAN